MTPAPKTGRPSLFRFKDRTRPRAGYMSKDGHKGFEAAKRRIAGLVGWKVSDISDSDTVEFLARGEVASIAYWRETGVVK